MCNYIIIELFLKRVRLLLYDVIVLLVLFLFPSRVVLFDLVIFIIGVIRLRSWFRDPYGDEPLHYCPNPSTFRALTSQLDLGWFLDAVHSLSGMEVLRASIITAHNIGQDELPMPYSPFFYRPLILLLRKSHNYLKRWFMTIRAGRKSYYDQPPILTDAITTDPQLRV